MKTTTLLALILPAAAMARPRPSPQKSPAFFLAGDSTTAILGGWGNGLLATLKSPAFGVNVGKSGATTKSFVEGGFWQNVTDHVRAYAHRNDVFVTISFGHNDQKEDSGVNITQYKTNLISMGNEVKSLGAFPLYVSSLVRRVYPRDQPNNATNGLAQQQLIAMEAAVETESTFIDLNGASLTYINAIGQTEAYKFNLGPNGTVGTDRTHLNIWGEAVFGRMVADLIQRELPEIDCWIKENKTMSDRIWAGLPP